MAGRTGQTVANVSHHLRVLDTAGLIEEAPELARTRRERWWRLVSSALKWSEVDFADDPAGAAVANAALSLNLEHHVSLVRAWWAAGDEARAHWWSPRSTGAGSRARAATHRGEPTWGRAPGPADPWSRLARDGVAEDEDRVAALPVVGYLPGGPSLQ